MGLQRMCSMAVFCSRVGTALEALPPTVDLPGRGENFDVLVVSGEGEALQTQRHDGASRDVGEGALLGSGVGKKNTWEALVVLNEGEHLSHELAVRERFSTAEFRKMGELFRAGI